jgi:flagellar hook assembly protein FlgD
MQLSQISGVEQMVEMRRRLEAIHDLLDHRQPPAPVETKPDRK